MSELSHRVKQIPALKKKNVKFHMNWLLQSCFHMQLKELDKLHGLFSPLLFDNGKQAEPIVQEIWHLCLICQKGH